MPNILELKDVSKNFGKLQAVSDLSFSVEKGHIHSLIGPNGAGKTTAFNLITGTLPLSGGQIFYEGEDISKLQPHEIAEKGICRSFQETFLFMFSTVLDNILIGFHNYCTAGPIREFFHTPSAKKIDSECMDKAMEIIKFMGLEKIKYEMPVNLPHGHQKALGVCIALATQPTLLLLDEPVTGMNPTETEEMVTRIRKIRDNGTTIVLVEHTMSVVMNISDKITVLNYGQKIAEGQGEEIRQNEEVIEAYLGKEEDDDATCN